MKTGAVHIENRDLRSSIDAINGRFGARRKVKEGRKVADTDNELTAIGRPLRTQNQIVSLQNCAPGLSPFVQ